jgi:hypothetical protein
MAIIWRLCRTHLPARHGHELSAGFAAFDVVDRRSAPASSTIVRLPAETAKAVELAERLPVSTDIGSRIVAVSTAWCRRA